MPTYVLLFTILAVMPLASESRCSVMELSRKLRYKGHPRKNFLENCSCNATSGFHDYVEQAECNCFQVPEESNCNLTCFKKGVQKYNETHKGFVEDAMRRIKACQNETKACYNPCDVQENVTEDVFWKRLSVALQNLNTSPKS